MRTIFKYELEVTENEGNGCTYAKIPMPSGARVLAVSVQKAGEVCVWVQVDPDEKLVTRVFWIVGTGREIPFSMTGSYLGTAFDGPYVWHIFGDRQ